ncbi:MAG: Eco57I restriction-modification methylase domain-containing protein [Planctomycetota bacterium]|jgi:Alw26I/Eco31I/Esp3I family type II restriction m6 adenine DNA methyltransferase
MSAVEKILDRCVDAYEVFALAAVEAGAPAAGLDLKARTLVLDLLSFRIARHKNILGSELTSYANHVFSQDLIRWSELADVLALFAERRCGAEFEKKSGLEGLWPLNEFVSENALSQALILLSDIDEDVPVRVLGDAYQSMLEIPMPGKGAEKAKAKMRRERKAKGIYFTPQYIIDKIIKLAIPHPVKGSQAPYVCDPAMGTAHFLISAAWYLAKGDVRSARHIAETRLYGVDSSPEIARLARMSMWLEFSSPLLPFEVPDHFTCGDSLVGSVWKDSEEEVAVKQKFEFEGFDWYCAFPEIKEKGGFDVVIGNPPYDVLTGFKKDPELKLYVNYLRKGGFYKNSVSGQLNLYRLFIERSLAILKNKGNLSFIVPSSFLTDKAASALRKNMLERHLLNRAEHFSESEKSFENVGQSVVIFLAAKNKGQARTLDIKSRMDIEGESERRTQKINIKLIEKLDPELMPVPLAGSDDWNIVKWLRDNCRAPFSSIADGYAGEVDQTVFADCIRDDKGAVLLRGCHVSPFKIDIEAVPGKARFVDEKMFLNKKGTGAKEENTSFRKSRVVQLGIRNMETRPRLVAARVPAGIYLGNSVNYWIARENVPEYLILALLNSSLYDWRFRLTSSNNNINVYEILNLPLPEALVDYFNPLKRDKVRSKSKTLLTLNEMEKKIKAIEKSASLGGDIAKSRAVIDEVVFHLFGMPDKMSSYIVENVKK